MRRTSVFPEKRAREGWSANARVCSAARGASARAAGPGAPAGLPSRSPICTSVPLPPGTRPPRQPGPDLTTQERVMCRLLGFLAPCLVVGALAVGARPLTGQSVSSPDGRNTVAVALRDGRLTWSLDRDGRPLILPSTLGFAFRGAPMLRDGLRVTDSTRQTHDEWWTQPWGEVARVRDHYNELAVGVMETKSPSRRLTLRVRSFDDGVGFRYEFPSQPGIGAFEISNE